MVSSIGRDLDAVAGHDRDVVLAVLADLQDRRVLQQGLQPRDGRLAAGSASTVGRRASSQAAASAAQWPSGM